MAGGGTPPPDLLTILVSLVVGLGGGVLGAIVTAAAQKRLANAASRAVASEALWSFHRTLHDYALEQESAVIKDGSVVVTKTTRDDIAKQRALAYPYKGYLGQQAKLVERLWYEKWEQGMDPLISSDDVWKWANELEDALKAAFPARRRD